MKFYVIQRIKDGKYWQGYSPNGCYTDNINNAMCFADGDVLTESAGDVHVAIEVEVEIKEKLPESISTHTDKTVVKKSKGWVGGKQK